MHVLHLNDFESKRKWLAFLTRGLFSLLFAVPLIFWPNINIAALLFLSAVYVLIDGTIAIWTGLLSQQGDLIVFGFIAILIGSYAFFPDGASNFFFLAFITAWALLRGIFELHAAFKLRRIFHHEWWLLISGTLSLMLSMVSISLAPSQVMGALWIFIVYVVVSGSIWIFLALEFRSLIRMPATLKTHHSNPLRSAFKFVKHKS